MENFTPVSALAGGILIGLGAAILLVLDGRIAGVSGIVGALLRPSGDDSGWRIAFVAGLIAAPLIYRLAAGGIAPITIDAPLPMLIAGGLLVGFGTNLGSGCTSGHGVCGIARLSPRSLAATATFMCSAMITVFLVRHVFA
ncbi:MAG: YeeE/YedE family protein [Gammaproteobacteria bacterium]|nr:YeeE/YedE family protein [Gammaproteobacteria bacterium]